MEKQNVIDVINNHLNDLGKIKGFKNRKENLEYIKWLENYFKDSEIRDCKCVEKIWVLLHHDHIQHCPVCGVKCSFRNFNYGYSEYCNDHGKLIGSQHSAQLKKERSPIITVTKKCKQCDNEFSFKTRLLNNTIDKNFCCGTCARKYMHANMSEEDKISRLEKTNKTNTEKYGTPWVVNSQYTRDKSIEKTGYAYAWQDPSVLQKCSDSLFERTGYHNNMQDPSTLARALQTKIDRYGDFLIPMYKYKDYTLPSGKIVKVQGREPQALDDIFKIFSEDDVFLGRHDIEQQIGKIYYTRPDGTTHIYYPDIYIKSINKVVEVKSHFTYDLHADINECKKEQCVKQGFNFEFVFYDRK